MKLSPIRTQLFLSYLIVLLLGIGLAAVLSWASVEKLYLSNQRENLLAQAVLIAAALRGQPIPDSGASGYNQTANVMPGIHTRLLGDQGAVLVKLPLSDGEIPVQAPDLELGGYVSSTVLVQRLEIIQASKGEPTTAIRRVPAAGNRRILYAAAPILAEDKTLSGIVYLAMPLPAAGLPTSWLLNMGGAIISAVILALITGSMLAHRIARPIENIERAAAAVGDGKLTQVAPLETSIRELNSLGITFNAMTESLRQSTLAKNAFISDVTHELRTPLTVIKGTIETLEDGALDDISGRGRLLSSMQQETERLIRLVNDLLVLTRADAGALALHIQPVDLVALVCARRDHVMVLAEPKQVRITMNLADPDIPVYVLADQDRLAQVLDNLLDNAIRYSPNASIVDITIRQEGDLGFCEVHDCGPGIPAQHLPFIFERFYRVDVSRNHQSGGAGLGLAIARALILAQDGQINAESREGDGAILRFSLPVCTNCHPIA